MLSHPWAKEKVDNGHQQLTLPLAVLVKAPTRGADGFSGLTAPERHDPQDFYVQPQQGA